MRPFEISRHPDYYNEEFVVEKKKIYTDEEAIYIANFIAEEIERIFNVRTKIKYQVELQSCAECPEDNAKETDILLYLIDNGCIMVEEAMNEYKKKRRK